MAARCKEDAVKWRIAARSSRQLARGGRRLARQSPSTIMLRPASAPIILRGRDVFLHCRISDIPEEAFIRLRAKALLSRLFPLFFSLRSPHTLHEARPLCREEVGTCAR